MANNFQKDPGADSGTSMNDRYQRCGQLLEVVTVVALAGSIGLGILKYDSSWLIVALLVFAGALISLYFAVALAARAESEIRKQAERVRYAINEKRIRTLETVRAPADALFALKEISRAQEGIAEFSEGELLDRLTAELGAARTNELKGMICKYLRVDEKDFPANSRERLPALEAKPKMATSEA